MADATARLFHKQPIGNPQSIVIEVHGPDWRMPHGLTPLKRLLLVCCLIPVAALGWWLFGPDEWQLNSFCSPEIRIDTQEQAIAFGKQLVQARGRHQEWGFNTSEDYLAAIERDSNCCSASYGDYIVEAVGGRGWYVSITGRELPYEHVLEFNRCRQVAYNGGLYWGPAKSQTK